MNLLRKTNIAILLLCVILGFFYKTILQDKLPIPTDTLVGLYHPWRDLYSNDYPRGMPFKNFLITDPIRQQIPWRKLVVDSMKESGVIGWNPYVFGGTTLAGNIQAAPFYPFNGLFFLMSFPYAWTLLIILQPILSSLFLYIYLRHLKLVKIASAMGAVSWAFCGFSISWLTWGTMVHAALWLPVILLSIHRLLMDQTKVIFWILCLITALSLTILAGHIQIALYVWIMAMAYAAFHFRHSKNRSGILFILFSGICSLVITSIQLVPLLEMVWGSGRTELLDSWKNEGWFLPWEHLIQFFVPDFFGNPATLNYWGEWNYGELVGYVGIVPIIFAFSALAIPGFHRFFLLAAGAAIFFMLPHAINKLPYTLHLPLISALQPTRLMVIVDFSLAVLCAIGVDYYIKKDRRKIINGLIIYLLVIVTTWLILTVLAINNPHDALLANLTVAKRNMVLPTGMIILVIFWHYTYGRIKGQFQKSLMLMFLFCVVVFDLYRFGWKFTPFTKSHLFFPESKLISYLKERAGIFRVMSLDDRILPPNSGSFYGLETVEGYDPIVSRRFVNFFTTLDRGKDDISNSSGFNRIFTTHNLDSPLLSYLNIRYVLSITHIEKHYLKEVFREGETRVFENTRYFPRAYIAETVKQETNPEKIIQQLYDNPEIPKAIVEKSIDVVSTPVISNESVSIEVYKTNEIHLKTSTLNKRLIVLLNQYDNRWKAKLSNTQLPVVRVNYLFTGVVVPSGTNEIILSYDTSI